MAYNTISIDGIELSEFGVFLAPDSYKSLLQWSSLKPIQTNDWSEVDYIEPDLLNPVLDKRSVTLNFHANGLEGYERFIDHLTQKAVFMWNFADLGVNLNLRIANNNLKKTNEKWQSFSITFIDDAPYTKSSVVYSHNYLGNDVLMIDAYNFGFFGISVLDGTLASMRQIGNVKERLTISANNIDGVKYDTDGDVKIKSNDFTIKCLLRAPNIKTAVSNYYALLYYIRRSGLRRIVIKSNLKTFDCYYKSATCENVHLKLASGAAGIAFTIVFTVVGKGLLKIIGNDGANEYLTDEQGVFLAP